MSFEVVESTIRRAWRESDDGAMSLLVRSDAPAQVVSDVLVVLMDRANEIFGESVVFAEVAPTPQGATLFVDHADDRDVFLEALRFVASELAGEGFTGKIGLLRNQPSPLHDPLNPIFGWVAGVSLVGTAVGPRTRPYNGAVKTWEVDPDTLDVVISQVLNWCQVPGGKDWIAMGGACFGVERDQREALIRPQIVGNSPLQLIAADGRKAVREVHFYRNGQIGFGIGGDPELDWEQGVEELKHVLMELHPCANSAFIQRSALVMVGWGRFDLMLWRKQHGALDPEPQTVDLLRAQEPELLAHARGIQLLGPEHPDPAEMTDWIMEPLGQGRRLLMHRDLAAWFSSYPSLDLLLDARKSLGTLAPEWEPTRLR